MRRQWAAGAAIMLCLGLGGTVAQAQEASGDGSPGPLPSGSAIADPSLRPELVGTWQAPEGASELVILDACTAGEVCGRFERVDDTGSRCVYVLEYRRPAEDGVVFWSADTNSFGCAYSPWYRHELAIRATPDGSAILSGPTSTALLRRVEAGSGAQPASGSSSSASVSTGLARFGEAARDFVDRFNAEWADAAAAFSGFSDEAVIIDPSNADFTIGPGPDIVEAWGAFARAVPDYEAVTTATYVGERAAAFPTEVHGLPVPLPDGLWHELRVFRFTDDTARTATAFELWYDVEDTVGDTANTRQDCVPPDRCIRDARPFAEAYLAAWTSGDPESISALYRDDATFVDTAHGLDVSGAGAIGQLSAERFGGATPACQVLDVYAQTDDGDPATSDNTDPKGGTVAAIAIVHRCGAASETGPGADAISLLLIGTRQARSFDNDAEGLIVSDEVLYDPARQSTDATAP